MVSVQRHAQPRQASDSKSMDACVRKQVSLTCLPGGNDKARWHFKRNYHFWVVVSDAFAECAHVSVLVLSWGDLQLDLASALGAKLGNLFGLHRQSLHSTLFSAEDLRILHNLDLLLSCPFVAAMQFWRRVTHSQVPNKGQRL